jgi:hypothetical protein
MSAYALYLADLVAIGILVFGLFLPRHRRPELTVALLTANIGVLAVASALSVSTIGAGLGLGLFGILSIIRLRSAELAHHEIAYYFGALALGLLGGLDQTPALIDIILMAAVLAALAIGDHPRVSPRASTQQVLLDRAVTDPVQLRAGLAQIGAAPLLSARIVKTDLVNDTTLVEIRQEEPSGRRSRTGPGAVPEHVEYSPVRAGAGSSR